MRKGYMAMTGALVILALGTAPGIAGSADHSIDENDYLGQVVVLDFWASWCVPCRRSFPWLNEMHGKYAEQGLVIIGVNLDTNPGDAEKFLAEFPAKFAIHYDDEKSLATKYDVMAMPSSYVIGRDGKLIMRHLGFKVRRQDEYEAIIVDALSYRGSQK